MKNLSSLILIGVSVAAFMLYIKPQWQTVSALRTQKATYESGLAQATQVQTLRDTLVAKLNGISDADQRKLRAIVPDTFDAAKLAADVSVLANNDGLSFKGISVGSSDSAAQSSEARTITSITPSASGPYKTHTITLSVAGQYNEFITFLKNIEASAQLFDVVRIDIAGGEQSTTGVASDLSFKVQAKTYSLK